MTHDWNNTPLDAVRSPAGVWLLTDYERNLIRPKGCPWPPAAIVQKLYADNRCTPRFRQTLPQVVRKLGFYCCLQSMHSEDAITWSYFGPLMQAESSIRVRYINWLCNRLNLCGGNSTCEISLLRRIAHPERLNPGGPEIDFAAIGDRTVILGEAKWLSPIGRGQGVSGDRDQIQLRLQWLAELGVRVFPDRELVVLGVFRELANEANVAPLNAATFHCLTWAELASYSEHPVADEFMKYLDWKNRWSVS